MTAPAEKQTKRKPLKPRPDVDREALRADIFERFQEDVPVSRQVTKLVWLELEDLSYLIGA